LKSLVSQNSIPAFDLCLLLGDQATMPTVESYRLLVRCLTKKQRVEGTYIHSNGLGMSLGKLLAITGNHDKLLLSSLDLYNNSFGNSLQLLSMPMNGVLLVKREFKGMEFHFIHLD